MRPADPPVIIIAPDKFKGTLTADEVSEAIRHGITGCLPGAQTILCPMADGGDGSAKIIARVLGLKECSIAGHDAMMQETDIHFYSDGSTCAADCASIVGLAMLGDIQLRPWLTTSYGVGEFIAAMLNRGMKRIFIGIGGTATIDGGAGMLQALGARFFDVDGEPLNVMPIRAHHLSTIYSIDFKGIPRQRLKQCVTALADVNVPLIPSATESMSSLSFAPQKGVAATDMPILLNALRNLCNAVDNTLYPAAEPPRFQGAGGGIGYAVSRVLRCQCESGAGVILSLYNLSPALRDSIAATSADTSLPAPRRHALFITGEGTFDRQSLQGKVTGTIISLADRWSIPAIVIAGKSEPGQPVIPNGTTIITTSDYLPPDTPLNHATALASLKEALSKKLPPVLASLPNPI